MRRTKQDLEKDLFVAKEIGMALQRKVAGLEEMVVILKAGAETAVLNARTIWALTCEEGGWSDDSE